MHYFLFIILTIFMTAGGLTAAEITDFSADAQKLALGKDVYLLEDSDGALTFPQIEKMRISGEFVKNKTIIIDQGFTNSVIWLHLLIKFEKAGHYFLQLENPLLEHVAYYNSDQISSKAITTGASKLFNSRMIASRYFVFKISANSAETQSIYLRIKNRSRMTIPLVIYSENVYFHKQSRELFSIGMYLGFLTIILLFNLAIFIGLKKRIFLCHTFFIFSFGLFITTHQGHISLVTSMISERLFNQLIPVSTTILLLASLLFTDEYIKPETIHRSFKKANYILMLIVVTTLPGSLFASNKYAMYAVKYHMGVSLLILVYMAAIVIIGIINKKKTALFFAFGWLAISIGGVIHVLAVAGVLHNDFIGHNALKFGSLIHFLILTIGLSLAVFKIQQDNINASGEIGFLQKRSDLIIEKSKEIVFILSYGLKIVYVNNTIKKYLMLKPEEVIGQSFILLLNSIESKKNTNDRLMIDEMLDDLIINKVPVRFQAEFTSSKLLEPKMMQVELEHIAYKGKSEILGRVSPVGDDKLLPFFKFENQIYEIDNYMDSVNETIIRITRNLQKFLNATELNILKTAIREILMNAVEHGNLEISYEEKSKALKERSYYRYLSEKRAQPGIADRSVTICYVIDDKKVEYIIKDCGNGFDYHKYLQDSDEKELDILNVSAHGRGITMAKHIFDEISYNSTGNEVRLVKYFNKCMV